MSCGGGDPASMHTFGREFTCSRHARSALRLWGEHRHFFVPILVIWALSSEHSGEGHPQAGHEKRVLRVRVSQEGSGPHIARSLLLRAA